MRNRNLSNQVSSRVIRIPLLVAFLLWVIPLDGFAHDVISVMDHGAVGNGIADDTAAVQNAINEANTYGKSVFLPGGKYLITSPINLSGVTLTGEGVTMEGGTQRSVIRAGTAGMTMLICGSGSQIENIGIQGADLANIGIKATGARVALTNIEIYRCRKTSYLLASTQNSTFVNCFSGYSVTGFTLANGARNNNFYNCTTNNTSTYYHGDVIGIPWEQTRMIYFVIDTTDPDYGTQVTPNGNDRNNWYGGIHERCPLGILFENLSGYTGNEGVNNQFYGVEFACSQVIHTQNSTSPGTLLMDSCCFILKGQDLPFGVGTSGYLNFQGECYFSGANNINNRGITQRSNYHSLFVIDTDAALTAYPYGGGNITTDPVTKSVTINGGNATVGAEFRPIRRGNIANSTTAINVGRPAGFNAMLTFTVSEIIGSNPVSVMLSLNHAPWRRTVAQPTTPGTYAVPIRIGEHQHDTFNVIVSANGNASCTVKGVSLKAVGQN